MNTIKKIAIVGCPGSGKSTLALQLHQLLDIPLYHIDQYFWKPGWQRPDRDAFAQVHKQLCDQDAWIIEGMAIKLFDYRIQKADAIIFLDIPWYRCFYRVFKRAFMHWGKVYFSSAPGCPEQGPDKKFLGYIWNFSKVQKPAIESLLELYKNEKKVFVLKSNAQMHELFKFFESSRPTL